MEREWQLVIGKFRDRGLGLMATEEGRGCGSR